MTTATIQNSIARGIALKQLIADATDELKQIKKDLITEAESRADEHKRTDGGGWSWEFEGADHRLVRVTEPARKLKGSINPEGKTFAKIKEAAGRAWSLLFVQVPSYAPVEDFKSKAVAHLGRDANKLIKLVTTESETTVNFEVSKPEGK